MKARTAKALTAFAIVVVLAQTTIANESESDSSNKIWNNYQTAIESAQQSGKPIMLVFSGSDWCGWCVRLQNEVFNTSQFNNWAQNNIHAVEVDFPRSHALPDTIASQNQMLKQKFGDHVQVYPTVLFIDANEQVIGKAGFSAGGPTHWIAQVQTYTPARPTTTNPTTSNRFQIAKASDMETTRSGLPDHVSTIRQVSTSESEFSQNLRVSKPRQSTNSINKLAKK